MFENLLSKSGIALEERVSKKQFQRNFGVIGVITLLLSIVGFLLYCVYGISDNIILVILWGLLVGIVSMIAICVFFLFLGITILGKVGRLHDMNRSGWWYFLGLVPIVGLIQDLFFLFADGDQTENKYGAIAKDKKVPYDSLVRVWGIIFFFTYIIVASVSSFIGESSKTTTYTPSKIAEEVSTLNKNIDMSSTDDPHITKYGSNGMTMIYNFQYNNPASDYDFSDARSNLVSSACKDSDIKKWMSQGVKLEYIFRDSEYQEVIHEIISKDDCNI